jgi:hypothetical protein
VSVLGSDGGLLGNGPFSVIGHERIIDFVDMIENYSFFEPNTDLFCERLPGRLCPKRRKWLSKGEPFYLLLSMILRLGNEKF